MFDFVPVAATGLLGLVGSLFGGGQPARPAPTPVPVVRTVSAAVVKAAPGPVRGTVILVHGGGWSGPDRGGQENLAEQPGQLLVERGWKVVSVDYAAGQAGLQDVLNATGAELAATTGGPVCLYGESSGAHLALIAAARLRAVDCVVATGAPTDFQAYAAEAQTARDQYRLRVADTIASMFGPAPGSMAPWEPVRVAGDIAADVMLVREQDDVLVPLDQIARFRQARPTTQYLELEPGNRSDPADAGLHGTVSAAARARFHGELTAFLDRAAAAHAASAAAAAARCPGANQTLTRSGIARVRTALRCLARRDSSARRGSLRRSPTSQRLRGEVTAARIWAALRATAPGRRALGALAAGRARAGVRSGDPSVVTVRVRG